MLINGMGALATGCTTCVVIVAKFTEGAWITVLAIPGLRSPTDRWREADISVLIDPRWVTRRSVGHFQIPATEVSIILPFAKESGYDFPLIQA